VLVLVTLLGALLGAAPARADSPRLDQARRAVAAVDYDAARRLLVEALHEGGNSPAAVGEIYRLSARAAVVLDQRELAEQYYRRWLAIDPDAALPGDTAPKLREPFVAAQAYIAAHGRLRARAQRTSAGEVDVELLADPLAMARAAAAIDATGRSVNAPVVFGGGQRAHLVAGTRIAILDDDGNRLLELEPGPVPGPGPGRAIDAPPRREVPSAPSSGRETSPPWTQRWITWAVPTGVFVLGAAGFGIAAIASYDRAHKITGASDQHYLSEAQDDANRGKIFTWITIGAGAAAIGCAIPTTIYFRGHGRGSAVLTPAAGSGQIGVALSGRF
jgi:hypothetical protein